MGTEPGLRVVPQCWGPSPACSKQLLMRGVLYLSGLLRLATARAKGGVSLSEVWLKSVFVLF